MVSPTVIGKIEDFVRILRSVEKAPELKEKFTKTRILTLL